MYVPSDSQETNLETYIHNFSLEVKMEEILTGLNWKWKGNIENIRHYKSESCALPLQWL